MIEDRFDGTQMYCVLCNYLNDLVEPAYVVVEGNSFCAEHARAVVFGADYIYRWSDGRFALTETIDRWRHAGSKSSTPTQNS